MNRTSFALGVLWLGTQAWGATSPRAAAALSTEETALRRYAKPRAQLALGFQEARNQEPVTLLEADLHFPITRALSLGLQAKAPTKRKSLSYYWGGELSWYGRPPYGGLWAALGLGRYQFRPASGVPGRTALLGTLGWRWRPVDHTGSFGIGVGPEVQWYGGKANWGGVFRFTAGWDFRSEEIFQ